VFFRSLIPESGEALTMLERIGSGARMDELIRFVGVRDSQALEALLNNLGSVDNIMAEGRKLVFETRFKGFLATAFGERQGMTHLASMPEFRSLDDLYQYATKLGNENLTRVLEQVKANPELLEKLRMALESQDFQKMDDFLLALREDEVLFRMLRGQSDIGPVFAGVVDTDFPNRTFFAINYRENIDPLKNPYPLLREMIRDFRLKNPNLGRHGMPGSHAELIALNNALWNRHRQLYLKPGETLPKEVLNEFFFHNISTNSHVRASKYFLKGRPFRCTNCFGVSAPDYIPVSLEKDVFNPQWFIDQ
jgi:hypothetical protein